MKPTHRRYTIFLFVTSFLFCFIPADRVYASDQDEVIDPDAQYERDPFNLFSDDFEDWIDRTFYSVDELLQDRVNDVDEFFSSDRNFSEYRGNRFRFRFATEFKEAESPEFKPQFQLQLALPNISKRLNLIFASVTDDGSEMGNTVTGEDTDNVFGLRFFPDKNRDPNDRFDSSISAGVLFGSSPDFIAKWRFRYKLVDDYWQVRVVPMPFYRGDQGLGIDTRLDFDRPFARRWMFRSGNRARYSEETDSDGEGVNFRNALALFYFPNVRYAFAGKYQALSHTRPNTRLEDHRVSVLYRQAIYRDILLFELEPGVEWERDRDFNTAFLAIASFELVFGASGGRANERLRNESERIYKRGDSNRQQP